ncbi:MAG: TylF/MycF/NovP-related O-methyltransferase [Legionellales bacterium]
MNNFILSLTQKRVVFTVRLSYRVRYFIGSCFHFLLKCLRVELRGRSEHSTLIANATYSPWRVDKPFQEVMLKMSSYSLLDEMRLYELWQLANQVHALSGDVIEVGCWRGGAGCMIAKRIAQHSGSERVFLCDTFQGMVKASSADTFYHGNELADTSEQMVADLAAQMGLQNISILAGIFPEETGAQIKDHLFKFAHIDVDVYQSARDAFEWLLPRLVNGAVVVFDDYGFASTPGIRQYIDELQGRTELVIIRNLNGQAVIIKR